MDKPKPLLTVRGSGGVSFIYGPPLSGVYPGFEPDRSKICKAVSFSKDGSFFAWCNGYCVKVVSLPSFEVITTIDKPRSILLSFSPCNNLLVTWEPYLGTKPTPQENANLHFWNLKTGSIVHSYIQKKQSNWCPQWTDDEFLCSRIVSNEVHFFEGNNFGTIHKKIYMQKVVDFSLAPGSSPHHIACYVPGVKGQPSSVRLFQYPKFEGLNSIVVQKSFFKADRVEFFWNKQGTGLIVQTITDVDKSGSSYYGEVGLSYISTNGDTSMIKLGKDGPIYSVQWSPTGKEFCVVYGFMPAKATLFNQNCESLFDFGTGPRNAVHYNLQANMLILCGFGNLRGNVEVWDLKIKKQVSQVQASDSTFLAWSPDGEHILTATTSPRLRIGNGYRLWHYTGSLLHEHICDIDEELFDIQWQPFPEGTFKEKSIKYTVVPGIEISQPQASKEVYRPPSARGKPSNFKLHEYEPPHMAEDEKQISKSALKNKKKKEGRKAKKELEKQQDVPSVDVKAEKPTILTSVNLTGDVEKDKKIKNLTKKLDQIAKLEELKKSGKVLELNQVEKINKKQELYSELQQLQLS